MAHSSSSTRRELAAFLMQSQTAGISAIVQERVHSTSIGFEATSEFLHQLVQELEDAVAQLLVPAAASLEHKQEVELGTLITASSLSVRYVTERDAMLPLLQRFRSAFSAVLHVDSWETAFRGLKTVALMASTRVLEAFGEHVASEEVVEELKWLSELFTSVELDEKSVQKANYLLRPACEYVSVAIQTHPAAESTIYTEVLPQLMALVQRYGDESVSGDLRVADSAQQELVSTIAVLLEAKLPASAADVYALLPMPSFVEKIESSEMNDSSTSDEDDQARGTANALPDCLSSEAICQCAVTLCSWLNIPGRRASAALVLPVLCHALHQQNQTAVVSVVAAFASCLHGLELKKLVDFEFACGLLESFRDVALRVPGLPSSTISDIYDELRLVMLRLENAIKSPEIEKKELRAIKATCSKIRQTLVEAFLAWIHNAGAEKFVAHQEDFLATTSTKLADPRIYGDALHVVRSGMQPDTEAAFRALVGTCANLLTRALSQLDRYTKVTANRIVSAVTRVAFASGQYVAPHADDLALPLILSILDGSSKGKSLRMRRESVACILLGCAQNPDFQFGDHVWISQYVGVLLETADSESAHTLSILAGLIDEPRLLTPVASVCVSKGPAIGQIFHESLSRWPLYEEDVDGVILTLAILKALLSVDALRTLLDSATIASTVQKLSANAEGDGLDEVVVACSEVLASDFLDNHVA